MGAFFNNARYKFISLDIVIIFSKNKTICKFIINNRSSISYNKHNIHCIRCKYEKKWIPKREILELYKIKSTRFILFFFIYISVLNYAYNSLNASYIYYSGEREAFILSVLFLTT